MNRALKLCLGFLVMVWVLSVVMLVGVFAWEGEVGGGGSLRRGNEDGGEYYLDVEGREVGDDWRLAVRGNYGYREDSDGKSGEVFSLSQEWEVDLSSRWYFSLGGGFDYSYGEGLDRRIGVGPGVGVYLLDRKSGIFKIGAGAFYKVEKYKGEDLNDSVEVYSLEAVEVELGEGIELRQGLRVYHEVDDLDNYRLDGDISLSREIFKALDLEVKLGWKYRSEVLVDRKRSDIVYGVGVRYSF